LSQSIRDDYTSIPGLFHAPEATRDAFAHPETSTADFWIGCSFRGDDDEGYVVPDTGHATEPM
jgi:hypothetical protein